MFLFLHVLNFEELKSPGNLKSQSICTTVHFILFYFPPNFIIKHPHLSTICSPFFRNKWFNSLAIWIFSLQNWSFFTGTEGKFQSSYPLLLTIFLILFLSPQKTSALSLKTKYSKGYIFFTPGNFQCYNVSAGKIFSSFFEKASISLQYFSIQNPMLWAKRYQRCVFCCCA